MADSTRRLRSLLGVALVLGVWGSGPALAAPASWTPAGEVNSPTDPKKPADQGDRPTSRFPNVPILRFAQVDAHLYRGGLPSETALRTLKGMGLKTDIDLMGEVPVWDTVMVEREEHWAKEVGIKFVQVKVPTGMLPLGLGGHISNAVANEFLRVALDPANQPCFVHCLHGRDRTGTMAAVYRMVRDHYTNATAYAEMKSFGFSQHDYPELATFVQQYHPTLAVTP